MQLQAIFRRYGKVGFGCVLALSLGLPTGRGVAAGVSRWWTRFPVPHKIYRCSLAKHASYADRIAAETLSGVVALHARTAGSGSMIWLTMHNKNYTRWRKLFLAHYHKEVNFLRAPGQLWALVRRFHKLGIIRGYILYSTPGRHPSHDISVNWATTLCASFHAIAITPALLPKARACGLRMMADARGKTFHWLLARLGDHFSHRQLYLLNPDQTNLRDEAVAAQSLVTIDVRGGGYNRGVRLIRPGGIVLGWGMNELGTVEAASRYALRVEAADCASNLPVLSSGHSPDAIYARRVNKSNVKQHYNSKFHYLSFILSDGDNVQWAIGNYCDRRSLWASPSRGAVPFGWSLPLVDLAQANPWQLQWMEKTARPGDQLFQYGLGYFYLDEYGKLRGGTPALISLMRSVRPNLEHLHIHTLLVFTKTWDSPAARRAYQVLARQLPDIRGIFAIQFNPYAAGRGKILWVHRQHGVPMPVISAQSFLWNQGKNVNNAYFQWPNYAARELNNWARHQSVSLDSHFAWLGIHAWSSFALKPGTRALRQYGAALYVTKHLRSSIRVVTPSQLVRLLIGAFMSSR